MTKEELQKRLWSELSLESKNEIINQYKTIERTLDLGATTCPEEDLEKSIKFDLLKELFGKENLQENKKIYFFVNEDYVIWSKEMYYSFEDTSKAIESGRPEIVTTSIANLSLDLIKLGYDIYLCKNGEKVQIKPGMPEIDKELRMEHNILRLFLGGVFDNCFKNQEI